MRRPRAPSRRNLGGPSQRTGCPLGAHWRLPGDASAEPARAQGVDWAPTGAYQAKPRRTHEIIDQPK
eukprot:1635374-Pyramimonas_sp.AAC.1